MKKLAEFHYLFLIFIKDEKFLSKKRKELDKIVKFQKQGKCPVFSEERWIKNYIIEAIPQMVFSVIFALLGAFITRNLATSLMIAISTIFATLSYAIEMGIFTFSKAKIRVIILKKLKVQENRLEAYKAAFESLESHYFPEEDEGDIEKEEEVKISNKDIYDLILSLKCKREEEKEWEVIK